MSPSHGLLATCLILGLLATPACGDDSGVPTDTGTSVDTSVTGDAALDTSVITDSSTSDTAAPPVNGHMSYVPPGLTPELANSVSAAARS